MHDPGPSSAREIEVEPAIAAVQAKHGIVRGTSLNFIGIVTTMLIGFFTTPFFVHHLGTAAYGVYSLVLVFTMGGYFGYLDLGLQTALVHRAAPHAAHGRWREFSRVASSSIVLLGALGLLAATALAVSAEPLAQSVFHVPERFEEPFVQALRLVALVLLVQFPGLAVIGSLQAVHRWDVVAAQRALASIAGVVVAVLFITRSDDVRGLIFPVVAAQGVGVLVLAVVARRLIPRFSLSVRRVSRSEFRELLGYGSIYFGAQAGIAIVSNLDQVLIAVFLSAHSLGLYAIAATIYYAVFALMAITNATVFAATSHLYALNDDERVRVLILRGTRYAASLVLCGSVAALWFGPAFIRAWVGSKFNESGILLVIWLTHFALTAFTGVGQNVLAAIGKVRTVAAISGISVFVNGAVSLALVEPLGMRGVILGTVLAYVVTGPLLLQSTLSAISLPWRKFAVQTVAPAMAAAAAAVGAGGLLRVLGPSSLGSVIGAALTTFAVGVFAAWALLPTRERRDLRVALRLR